MKALPNADGTDNSLDRPAETTIISVCQDAVADIPNPAGGMLGRHIGAVLQPALDLALAKRLMGAL